MRTVVSSLVFTDPAGRPGAGRTAAIAAIAWLWICGWLPVAMAQQPPAAPGAGDVVRELPAPPALPRPAEPGATTTSDRPSAPLATGMRFTLRELQLKTPQAVAEADIRALLQPYLGQTVGDAELAEIRRQVRALYESRGLGLAAIGYPSQDLRSGVLTLHIVEPRLGQIGIEAGEQPPLAREQVRGVLARQDVVRGQPLNLQRLDRALFLLNDLPGVQAKATLSPSGEEGVFDLGVTVAPRRAWDAAVTLDNHGSKTSGRWRAGGLVRWNNPLGIGDNLDARLLFSDTGGVGVGRLAYEAPLGTTPARLTVGYSRVGYSLGGEFEELDANGSADILDVGVSYPLIRMRGRNLMARVGYEDKKLVDRFDAFDPPERTEKSARSLHGGLFYEGRDAGFGGGYVGASMQVTFGDLDIGTRNVREADRALGRRATQGSFTKINTQVSRLQAITPRLSGYLGLTHQWADKNLDNAEKLSLGGPNGVRAYPASEAAVDQGLIANAELRWWLDPRWTVFGLADWARGHTQKRPEPQARNKPLLGGYGLGVFFSHPDWFSLKATLAWRGDTQPQTESGNDQPRLYIQMQRAF